MGASVKQKWSSRALRSTRAKKVAPRPMWSVRMENLGERYKSGQNFPACGVKCGNLRTSGSFSSTPGTLCLSNLMQAAPQTDPTRRCGTSRDSAPAQKGTCATKTFTRKEPFALLSANSNLSVRCVMRRCAARKLIIRSSCSRRIWSPTRALTSYVDI